MTRDVFLALLRAQFRLHSQHNGERLLGKEAYAPLADKKGLGKDLKANSITPLLPDLLTFHMTLGQPNRHSSCVWCPQSLHIPGTGAGE